VTVGMFVPSLVRGELCYFGEVRLRGMAHEIIKKSKKDTHDAREATKAAEKAAELERRICIA
jgi:hypothetical protein